jgi:histidinol dehydrogenase
MIRILSMKDTAPEEIFARAENPVDVSAVVRDIIADVRANGDKALFAYSRKFDKNDLKELAVSQAEWEEGLAAVGPELKGIIERAAVNIRAFHEAQKRTGFVLNDRPGILTGQRILPIEKVGLYIPGGLAAYPSSVLMNVIPAKIAGCEEVVITTPANREGKVNPAILAAAWIAGADKIFKVGGAQAIAALAYGTESVPKVDKIVGPGNAFVSEAKRQVFGTVAIDMIAGPSEILIVADGKSNPKWVAADLLSQAEHDRIASAVLVTDSEDLAKAVQSEIEAQLKALDREEIARASIETNGKIIVAGSIDEAIDVSNAIAPEHLELSIDEPFAKLGAVKNAGSVFLGRYSPEALGDYYAGTNHVLPTMGTARFSSALSVDDFIKKTQYIYYTKDAFRAVADDIAGFAESEGLTGHAKSALSRKED